MKLIVIGVKMNIYDLIRQMETERKTIYDMPLRVTFYVRVSTTKDEQINSLHNQINEFTNMIKSNENWTYVEGYIDTVRGESTENRENFLRMMEDAKSDKFDLIIAKENSRFSRDLVDSIKCVRELLRYNVGAYFTTDGLCTLQSDSELRLGIMASIAQEEVRKLSSRVKFGHRKSIEKGVVLGNNRIIGYDYIDKKLIINEQQAHIVRNVFELYQKYRSTRKVSDMIYDMGYRGANGNNKISKTTISSIIQNPKYKGYYCGGKVQIEDYRTKKQRFIPKEDWITYKDESIPAIVDEELWDECNSILNHNSDVVHVQKRNPRQSNCFSSKIFCMEHDRPYPFWRNSYSNRLHKDENIYQYVCSYKKEHTASDCPTFPIYEHEMYTIMRQFFKQFKDEYLECLDDVINIFKNVSNNSDDSKIISSLNDDINKLQKKKSKLLDLYIDEAISKSDYQTKSEEINNSIDKIKEHLDETKSKEDSQKSILSNINQMKIKYTDLFSNIDDINKLTDQEISFMVDDFIDRIEVTSLFSQEMNIVIKIKYGEKYSQTLSNKSRHMGNMVKYILTVNKNFSACREDSVCNKINKRTFSCSVSSEKPIYFAFFKFYIYVFKGSN